jgi:hypothetical protein
MIHDWERAKAIPQLALHHDLPKAGSTIAETDLLIVAGHIDQLRELKRLR